MIIIGNAENSCGESCIDSARDGCNIVKIFGML